MKDFKTLLALARSLLTLFFFQITSDYLIPHLSMSSSGEIILDLEGTTFNRRRILFHSSCMNKLLQFSNP